MTMKILVLNLGTTSFKFKLYDFASGEVPQASGQVERVGSGRSAWKLAYQAQVRTGKEYCADHEAAFHLCMDLLADEQIISSLSELDGVGFKAVHGGPLRGAQEVDEHVLSTMNEYAAFAPAHNPMYTKLMRRLHSVYPDLRQVACFETLFHAEMPLERAVYGVPFEWMEKYGIRDYRGGGRSSARETAMRVAAGGVARKILGDDIKITGALVQIGDKKINSDNWDDSEIRNNPFWCPDANMASKWETYLDSIRKSGSSIGAVIEVRASGVPAGLGAPIYGKLDADLAAAMMSINAVKGVEIGAGFDSASLTGEQNADEIRIKGSEPHFKSNHAGGILGGISSGQDLIVRFAVKPTSSILTPRETIDTNGNETEILTKGRHDPCVGIRAVPIGEAMMACVIADHMMRHKAQCS